MLRTFLGPWSGFLVERVPPSGRMHVDTRPGDFASGSRAMCCPCPHRHKNSAHVRKASRLARKRLEPAQVWAPDCPLSPCSYACHPLRSPGRADTGRHHSVCSQQQGRCSPDRGGHLLAESRVAGRRLQLPHSLGSSSLSRPRPHRVAFRPSPRPTAPPLQQRSV
ncbi:hypothetical protein HJG60_009452 [Phyllostomus discolor]|uniref:Uncharacterized protein n=1 Tax=Phyllostomus discolor TaxID=89673 RepID=A0A833YGH8_9CHIR|nr:hypothetical protein HJG60_009452 [Phyllostomus discolor]